MRPPYLASGSRRHQVTIETPSSVSDGHGGFIETWTPITAAPLWAQIVPASARALERLTAGSIVTTASHVVTIPYVPGVTTHAAVRFKARVLHIAGIVNPEERDIQLLLFCVEREANPATAGPVG